MRKSAYYTLQKLVLASIATVPLLWLAGESVVFYDLFHEFMTFIKFFPKGCGKFVVFGLRFMGVSHRIKDDIMENSIKEIRIWHFAFAASIILCSTPT